MIRSGGDSGEPGCLVERELFAEQFARAYRLTARGRSQAVLVTGPVASGKTELVNGLLRDARGAGALVLEAVGLHVTETYQMGVLRQLIRTLPPEQAGPLHAALAPLAGSAEGLPQQLDHAHVAFAFRDAVQAVAERIPVVLFIDDIQFADSASLEVVMTLRGCGVARVLSVLVERTGSGAAIPAIHRSLSREQDGLHIPLGMLSEQGTAALIARQLGARASERLAPQWHQVSGGNLVLLNALLDECDGAEPLPAEPPVGEAFARSVMRCLFRAEPTVLRLAQVLAMLDGSGTPKLVSQLLGLPQEHAEHAIENLTAMGLAEEGQLRHASIASAVRTSIAPAERAELRLRAARMRYADGARGSEVAELIEAGGGARGEWAVHVLREAAAQCLAAHDCEQSVRYLRLAERACENRQQRLEVTAALARATWRQDPQWAERYATELVAGMREGLLGPADSLTLVAYLMWCGHLEKAHDVLSGVINGRHVDEDNLNLLQAICFWMPRLYPSMMPLELPGSGAVRPPSSADGPESSPFAGAESVLLPGLWDDASSTCVLAAVVTLTYTGRLDDAEGLLERLAGHSTGRRGPTWQAVVSACEAEIALRRGRPAVAEGLARAALDGISYTGWGALLAGPLSTVIAALTSQNKLEGARQFLEVPLPKNALRSLAGPHVLLARGQCHLAVGQPKAALVDFTRCGRLLGEWGSAETPPLPWRGGVAEASLRSGRAQPGGAGKDRADSQNELRTLGTELDRLRPRHAVASTAASERERSSKPERGGVPHGRLSRAEQRVASLASSGHSNREIAQELHLTVSTVEQHLTRIYRKLGISGRELLRGMALAGPVAGP